MAEETKDTKHSLFKKAGIAVFTGAILLLIGSTYLLLTTRKASLLKQSSRIHSVPTTLPTITSTALNDLSTWNTFMDRKYGFSLKLPLEFYSVVPEKALTGKDPDPFGSGEMIFADKTSDRPNVKYGFTVHIQRNNHLQANCTTDQDCFIALNAFYQHQPKIQVYPLHATILQRNINGLAVHYLPPVPTVNEYYEFVFDGKPYEINVYYVGTYDQFKGKQPVIDAILSTISFR